MAWETWLTIKREAAELAAKQANQPPAACPDCGEPLESGPGGVLHCRFSGFIWDGTTTE